MPLYLFACKCGASAESLRPRGTSSIPCACGRQAERLAIYGPSIGGRSRMPASERPVSLRQYTEAAEQVAYEQARAEESAQQSLPSPGLWKRAREKAARLRRSGINDSLDFRPDYTR